MKLTSFQVGSLTAAISFTFFTVVMNRQSHGWFDWYQLAQMGQVTQAIVTDTQTQIHHSCSFQYKVADRSFQSSEGGCYIDVGQAVQVTYLPFEPSVVTLKSPQTELAFQLFAVVFLSASAGIVSAWRDSAEHKKL